MEDLNNNENEIMEDLSKSDDEGSIIEEGLIVEILPNKNILIINKRTIYLYYINSLEKKDYYFIDKNSHKHRILDAKLLNNNLIVTLDKTTLIIWEYTKEHFIQINKKIKINNNDDYMGELRLIKSKKYPKTIYIIYNNNIIQYNLITGELILKYLLEISYELTKHFHEFFKPFTFYEKESRKEYFFYIESESNTIIKLSEKNKIISKFNANEYYKGKYYFIGKNEKLDCFYIVVHNYKSFIFNIYCYDFNFEITSYIKLEYKNTLYMHYQGDTQISDYVDVDYVKTEFIDINNFYFIYMLHIDPPFENITIGLGTSENCGKNIPLHIGCTAFYDEEGNNFWGIKNLNKDQLLVWLGNDYKIIQKEQFYKNNSEGIFN